MFGWIRNALAIGLIAYFSPVHEQDVGARVQAMAQHARQAERIGQAAQASGQVLAKAGSAAAAAGVFDPASQQALTRRIDIAASNESGKR